jgi:hypothetical protein
MCGKGDAPPYESLDPIPVKALAQAMSREETPPWPVIEQAEVYLLRLAVRGWQLVNVDEDDPHA